MPDADRQPIDKIPTRRLSPRHRRFRPTHELDRLIREAYTELRAGDRSALGRIAVKISWTRLAVIRRGAELGLAVGPEKPWSSEEEAILEKLAHHTISTIADKFRALGVKRTRTAIAMKVFRLKLKSNLDGYSATQLALAFGVDSHKILRWIQVGALKAERRGPESEMWWISRSNVKAFILSYPEEINLCKVEKFWFLDIITGGRVRR